MHHPTDRITHTTAFAKPVVEHWLDREIAQWVHHEGAIRRLWDGAYKRTLAVNRKEGPMWRQRVPLSLSEWSFTICPTPYNRKIKCVECVVK